MTLLARMILNQCGPLANTYTLEDLKWLSDVNETVARLPAEQTKQIAREVARARIEGKAANDTGLQLKLNRMIQAKREEAEVELQEARNRARTAEDQVHQMEREREGREQQLVLLKADSIKRLAKQRLVKQILSRLLIALVVSIGAWYVAQILVPAGDLLSLA